MCLVVPVQLRRQACRWELERGVCEGVQHVLAKDIGGCRSQRFVTCGEGELTHAICNEVK